MRLNLEKAYLLAIESATTICAAALFLKGRLVSERFVHSPRGHNERLAVMVDDLLTVNSINADELTHIAVSIGPGSFTGLRVGLSFAKGLTLGSNCQIIPVNTLQALAHTIYRQYRQTSISENHAKTVFASTIARKAESFGGLFEFNSGSDYPMEVSQTRLYQSNDLQQLLDNETLFGGEGVDSLLLNSGVQIEGNDRILWKVMASAVSVGYIGLNYLENGGEAADIFNLQPMYINEFTVHRR